MCCEETMTDKERLVTEIESLPEQALREILDFVEFLKRRSTDDSKEVLTTSESSLRKDWLRPEEEAAWRNL